MPKTRSSKTETIRLELQTSEREQLDKIATSVAFKNYMKPLVDIATDNSLFYVILLPALIFLASTIGLTWIYSRGQNTQELIEDFVDTYTAAREVGTVPAIGAALFSRFAPVTGANELFNQDPTRFATIVDNAIDEQINYITNNPGTWVLGNVLDGIGIVGNTVSQPIVNAIPGTADDSVVSFIGRLFDSTPNNLW